VAKGKGRKDMAANGLGISGSEKRRTLQRLVRRQAVTDRSAAIRTVA